MTDKDDKIQHPKEKKDDESRLWAAVTKEVIPLKGKKVKNITISEKKTEKLDPKSLKSPSLPIPKSPAKAQKPEIDHRTAERLRKGQMPIEARLDLHGMTREAAYEALCGFILRVHKRGLRCVLIITGKGAKGPLAPEDGVLKQKTPEWLSAPPLDQYVLKTQISKQKDGGSGALYVLLRRKRD